MDKKLRETTNLGVDDSSWPKATSLTPMISSQGYKKINHVYRIHKSPLNKPFKRHYDHFNCKTYRFIQDKKSDLKN